MYNFKQLIRKLIPRRELMFIWRPGTSKIKERPAASVILQNFPLDDDKINELVVGIPIGTGNKKTKLIFELPVGITHNFNEELQNVTLKFNFGQDSPVPVPNDGIRISQDSIEASKVSREYVSNSEGQFVILKYPKLGSRHTFMIKELLTIGPSVIETVVPLTTKDDISVKQTVRGIFAAYFGIAILTGENLLTEVKIRMYGFECKDSKDLLNIYMKYIQKDKPKDNFEMDSDLTFFYYPKYKQLHKDKYVTFFMGEHDPSYLIPLKWSKDEN